LSARGRGDPLEVRGQPRVEDVTEMWWQPLYDTELARDGQWQLDFFQQCVGSGQPPKTFADTNIITGCGVLPHGKRFFCVGIELVPGAATAEDLAALLDHGVLEFMVSMRCMLRLAPLSCFYFGRSHLAHWWQRWLRRVGDWIDRLLSRRRPSMYELVPVLLREYEQFQVRITFAEQLRLSAPIRVSIHLCGYEVSTPV